MKTAKLVKVSSLNGIVNAVRYQFLAVPLICKYGWYVHKNFDDDEYVEMDWPVDLKDRRHDKIKILCPEESGSLIHKVVSSPFLPVPSFSDSITTTTNLIAASMMSNDV